MTNRNTVPIWQVDAFADRPFTGNPAAVCLLSRYPSDQWLQQIASEMNLSETSFIVPGEEANAFQLRWFTPATEVDLCGHATLAAAHTLIEQRRCDDRLPIRFQTRSGELACARKGTAITLDFPATLASEMVDGSTASRILDSLSLDAGCADTAMILQTKYDVVVVVSDSCIVESLRPDFNAMERIETRGVMVTALSDTDGVDFVSRFFAPRCGINEDPVTGSAHCCLAPYWSEQTGKTTLIGYQASQRGGFVRCQVAGERVRLTGEAVTVLEGSLLLDMP